MLPHLISCTLTALAALGASLAMRRGAAGWRHAMLFAALLRFAAPTSWLAGAGGALVHAVPAGPGLKWAAGDLEWLLTGPGWRVNPGSAPAPRPAKDWPAFFWMAGAAVCLAFHGQRWLRRIPPVRPATDGELAIFRRAGGGPGTELRIVSADKVPGALGWWRACVILPDGLAAQLTEAELESVLAHELAHVARRDNLAAAIAHTIVSVFWFHPLLWWIERRMLAERETACDELALAHGARAEDYVAAICKVCRMSFAGAAGYAGATDSNLGNRMEHIMSVDLRRGSRMAPRLLAGALFLFAVLQPVGGGLVEAQQAQPQGQAPQSSSANEKFLDGAARLQQKQYAEAEAVFREALRLDPDNTRILMGLVEAKMAQNQSGEAIELLQEEVAKSPGRMDIRLALGNTAVRARDYDLALATFQGLIDALDPDSKTLGDLHLRLGETYRRKGDVESALANLRKAKELTPDSLVAGSTLALVLDESGRKDEAVREYRGILKLDPRNGVALNNLAYLLSQDGDLDEALDFALRAKEALPNMIEISDTLGWIYMKKNLPDQAIGVFDALVRKAPENATYHYHFGMALSQKGDKFAAAAQLKEALSRSPSEEEARKIRRLLDELGQ